MKTLGSQLGTLLEGAASRRQLVPFARYIGVLVAVILLYGWLFHVIMAWEGQQHSWFTGIYWALTVMSTLGFGDITFTTDLGRVFSSVVLLSGVVLLLIILPFLFIRLVYAPWLEERARTQLAALQLRVETEDAVEDAATRGLISLALDGFSANGRRRGGEATTTKVGRFVVTDMGSFAVVRAADGQAFRCHRFAASFEAVDDPQHANDFQAGGLGLFDGR